MKKSSPYVMTSRQINIPYLPKSANICLTRI